MRREVHGRDRRSKAFRICLVAIPAGCSEHTIEQTERIGMSHAFAGRQCACVSTRWLNIRRTGCAGARGLDDLGDNGCPERQGLSCERDSFASLRSDANYEHAKQDAMTRPATGPIGQRRRMSGIDFCQIACGPRARAVPARAPIGARRIEVEWPKRSVAGITAA